MKRRDATRWRALWHVTLPLVRPGIVAGALLAMILAFVAYVLLLGASAALRARAVATGRARAVADD